MWQSVDSRVQQNEAEGTVPLRQAILEAIKTSGVLRPGETAAKKMVQLLFGDNERFVWEIEGQARNVFLHNKWKQQLEGAGFFAEPRNFDPSKGSGGGRHTGLNGRGAFGTDNCVVVRMETAQDIRRLLDVVAGGDGALRLSPEAVSRWIGRLRSFFPDFERFDSPDPAFDESERTYKLTCAEKLRSAILSAADDRAVVDAIHSALSGSNLLPWRAYWPISPKGDADRIILAPALREVAYAAMGDPSLHPSALQTFVEVWMAAVPDAKKDPARQIGEFLFLHLSPADGVYIRHTVRQDFWLEGVGSRFPEHESVAKVYEQELRFMRAVKAEFDIRGLGPRDMIDVQSALWVAHNYGDSEEVLKEEEILPKNDRTPENLILYGPPGTGKTYRTAREAVRLCLSLAQDDPILTDRAKRAELMSLYRGLVADGRVDFVTFHQSYSYEDFVEGLRPSTGSVASVSDDSGEHSAEASSGFSLVVYDGAFKRIAERARLDTGGGPPQRLDRGRPIFKVSLGRRSVEEDRVRAGLEANQIHLGAGGDIDWSDPRYEEFHEIKTRWNRDRQEAVNGLDGNIVQTWSFRSDMQVGDYVVVSDGRDRFRALGRITGDYFFDRDAPFHPHRRNVEWLWQNPEGADTTVFYGNRFRTQSAYQLNKRLIDWDGLESVVFKEDKSLPFDDARDFVLIIDEINRANISKVFGELITLLEADKRLGCENEIRLRLPYSSASFGVPCNLHIIGTMNTADRSIALLDTALRRRFSFQELMPDPSALPPDVEGIDLQSLLSTINERIEYLFDREHQIGHAYFTSCRTRADVEDVMRHKVIPLLSEYFYDDWSKVAAVLGERDNARPRFVESRRPAFAYPAADSLMDDKVRWTVATEFDFSEFASR